MREEILAGYPVLAGRMGALGLREMFELLRAKRQRDREAWRHRAYLMAEIRNSAFGQEGSTSAKQIAPFAFDVEAPRAIDEAQAMAEEEELKRRYEARLAREAKARAAEDKN